MTVQDTQWGETWGRSHLCRCSILTLYVETSNFIVWQLSNIWTKVPCTAWTQTVGENLMELRQEHLRLVHISSASLSQRGREGDQTGLSGILPGQESYSVNHITTLKLLAQESWLWIVNGTPICKLWKSCSSVTRQKYLLPDFRSNRFQIRTRFNFRLKEITISSAVKSASVTKLCIWLPAADGGTLITDVFSCYYYMFVYFCSTLNSVFPSSDWSG